MGQMPEHSSLLTQYRSPVDKRIIELQQVLTTVIGFSVAHALNYRPVALSQERILWFDAETARLLNCEITYELVAWEEGSWLAVQAHYAVEKHDYSIEFHITDADSFINAMRAMRFRVAFNTGQLAKVAALETGAVVSSPRWIDRVRHFIQRFWRS